MKRKLLYVILCFISMISYGQQWVNVGAPQFTNIASDAAITFDTVGIPYVVYADETAGNIPKVKYFDGTNWVDVGGALSNDSANKFAIAINPNDGQPWVVYRRTTNNQIRLYGFNGTSWVEKPNVLNYASDNSEYLTLIYNSSYAEFLIRTHDHSQYNATWRTVGYRTNNNTWAAASPVGCGRSTSNNVVASDKLGNYVYSNANIGNNFPGFYQGRIVASNTNFNKTVGGLSRRAVMAGNFWVAHISSPLGLEFYEMSTSRPTPQVSVNAQDHLLSLDRDYSDNKLYLGYANTSDEYAVETYNINGSVWSSLASTGISTNTSGFFAKTIVNEFEDVVYVMYRENNRVSVLKYEPAPALARYYVDANVVGGNGSGDSWSNAMTNINDALLAADETTTEVWVAQGTYSPTGGRTATFNILTDDLEIYGGFDGTENSIAERDVFANETILSGDLNNNDTGVDYTGMNRTDNTYHVIQLNANNVTLDGLTIKDGHANATSGLNAQGGAILISVTSSGLILKNCNIIDNVSVNGGAIKSTFDTNASVVIENCKFQNNVGKYACGAYLLANNNRSLTIDITNTLFSNNISKDVSGTSQGYTGSSVWLRAHGTNSNVTTTITNCTFANNTDIATHPSSTQRGTLAVSRNTSNNSTHNVIISNSIIYNNIGTGNITTLDINRGHVNYPSSVLVYNSIGEDNFSTINTSNLTNTSNANPLFTDATNGDFTLQVASPAVDSGDNTKVPSGIVSDLLGNQRVFNSIVDLGVYEFGAPSLSSSTQQLESNYVKLYPNPTNHILNIQMSQELEKATIYSVLGTKVLERTSSVINVSTLKAGIYILEIEAVNGSKLTKRFIKK